MSWHFAYIDPGSGSLFIQALIGFVLGGTFMFRRFLGKMVGKITKSSKHEGSAIEPKKTEDE